MSKWLKQIRCFLSGHERIFLAQCPVTGVKVMACPVCKIDNTPRHKRSSFN
jgi:hypothetical protein